MKIQPAAPLPLEHLDPQTPQLSQLVSQWQKLWVLALARQKRLEHHQQTLKEVGARCHQEPLNQKKDLSFFKMFCSDFDSMLNECC